MIESPSGWVLAPAYDLLNVAIAFPEDTEELALTLEGKKKKLKREHFERLGRGLGLTDKQIQGVFTRMVKHKPDAIKWVDKSFLSDDLKEAYKNILTTRYEQLNLNDNQL
jgi:serine/threonine-protein kinase HipA